MTTFERALEFTLRWEGGYQDDPNDRGNWTTGTIGEGHLLGTDRGISAMLLHRLRRQGHDLPADPRDLTPEQVGSIYRDRFWRGFPERLDAKGHYQLAVVTFDAAVNSGPARAKAWAEEEGSYAGAIAARLLFLVGLDSWSRYGRGWARRVASLLRYARDLPAPDSPVEASQPPDGAGTPPNQPQELVGDPAAPEKGISMLKGFKTYIGIAIAVLGGLAGALDIEPAALPGWVDQAMVVIGGLFAALGRWDKERRSPDPR